MKKVTYTVLSLLLFASAAFGQGGPISGFTELTDTDTSDELAIVDKSATPPVTGTTKRITVANLLKLLHGDLNVNSFDIVSDSGVPINIIPGGTGEVILRNFAFDVDQTVGAGQDNYVLTYDNSGGLISLEPNGYGVPQAVTISGGVATLTGPARPMMAVVLTSEGGSGADILDTVTLAGIANGTNIQFSVASGSQVTFADGTDNLDLGADMLMDSTNETIVLRYNGTNLVQGSNSANIETVEIPTTMAFAISDETTAVTASDTVPKLTYYAPYAMTATSVGGMATTAPVGATMILDIHLNGTSIMTTNKIDILTTANIDDDTATLTTTAIAADDKLEFFIDQIGSGTAGAGVKVWIDGTRN